VVAALDRTGERFELNHQHEAPMKTFELRITPDKAREFLKKNKGNRPIRASWVENLAGMIQRGEWETTHQGIAFDEDGNLLDGQHRLNAIIAAGKAVDMLVTTGLDKDVFKHIDGGRVRTPADRLKLLSDEHDNTLAVGCVRAYLTAAVVKNLPSVTIDMTDNAFLEMADEFTAVAEAFHRRIPGITVAPVGAAIACYMSVHKMRGRAFLASMVSGEGLSSKSPVLVLREALVAKRVGSLHDQYWKTIQATKSHYGDRQMVKVQAATEDWRGNKYSTLAYARSRAATRGAESAKVLKMRQRA
jgi:hypothetical protein